MRRLLMVALLAVSMATASAGAAFAGEVNGHSGEDTGAPSHANSVCAFSGQSDGGPGFDRVQSFGQKVKSGASDPTIANPGDAEEGCRGGSNPRNP